MSEARQFRKIEVVGRKWRRDFNRSLRGWEEFAEPASAEHYFPGADSMPRFGFEAGGFDWGTAWWLAELSRLAYTPDHHEIGQDWSGRLPRRGSILRDRTLFDEVISIHKTGNHASIYTMRGGRGPTVLCFRGSARMRQWMMNLLFRSHGWRRFREAEEGKGAFVHSGFYVFFKRMWPLLHPVLERNPRPWIFTGHSLGGALASIAGAVARPDLVCTFGAPKAGNREFHALRNADEVWRIVNESDLVPRLPIPAARRSDRELVHGWEAMVLGKDGKISSFEAPSAEEELPFEPTTLPSEFREPPAWISQHRIGEYADRLRQGLEKS